VLLSLDGELQENPIEDRGRLRIPKLAGVVPPVGDPGAIAEAAAVGLPMVLVPGTFGGGHQEENAEAMVKAGAAVRIADADLTGETLVKTIDSLDPERMRSMAKASAAAGRRDAAQRVLAVLHEVVNRK